MLEIVSKHGRASNPAPLTLVSQKICPSVSSALDCVSAMAASTLFILALSLVSLGSAYALSDEPFLLVIKKFSVRRMKESEVFSVTYRIDNVGGR